MGRHDSENMNRAVGMLIIFIGLAFIVVGAGCGLLLLLR